MYGGEDNQFCILTGETNGQNGAFHTANVTCRMRSRYITYLWGPSMNRLIKLLTLAAGLLFWQNDICAQSEISDSTIMVSQISVFGAHYVPAGDFADRFLSPTMIGAGYHLKTRKNWLFGVDGGYMFRDGLRNPQDYLTNMRTNSGHIIAQNGDFASVIGALRGFVINGHVGKLFDWIGPNPNSGIVFRVGGGFFQHKIHFEARKHDVPQLEDEMRIYYDQMSSGFSLNQFIGYQNLANSRLTNFYIGIEAIQAFTKNQRDFNIDLGGPDESTRTDLLIGLKAGWIVLIYKRKPKEFYFY